MALKDLVAQKSALTEEAIEDIVADFVRFDTDEVELAFTPEFAALSNKSKVLVYLVALQGWPFVTEDAVEVSAKPAEISEALGIPGGTLRPILKEMKDGHLISVSSGKYSVRNTHFETVKSVITGGSAAPATSVKKRKKVSKKKTASKMGSSGSRIKNTGLSETLNKWIGDGHFDEGRTTADVRDRFHEEAVIIPASSVPGMMNTAVRNKLLTRKKEDVNGKQVWVYRTKK